MGNSSLVQDLYVEFGGGDIAAVMLRLDPKVEWREAEGNPYQPSGAAWIGPEVVMQNVFLKLQEDWKGFSVHPRAFHDAGDTIAVEGRYSGTHRITGKVASCQQFVDTAALQDAMRATS